MKYAKLTQRIASEGAAAWEIHYEAQAQQRAGRDVIILSVGDPDLASADVLKQAVNDALSQDLTHYSDCQGILPLRERIALWESERRASPLTADQVVVQAGAQSGLYSLAQCLFEFGDELIIPEPMYITYEAAFASTGAKIVNTPLKPDDHWRLDLDALTQAVNKNTKAIVINSPNNPTGAMLSTEEWEHVIELVKQHDLWLIVDEVYSELVFSGEHPIGDLHSRLAEQLITINSLSKSHAMTGWRVGWVCCNSQLAEHLTNLALCMHYGLPSFVQQAAITAFDEYDHIVPEMRATYERRRNAALEVFADEGIDGLFVPPSGMFLMLDVRDYMASATEFAEALLREEGVSVLVGDTFGTSAQGHIRLSFCLNEARIREAISRIARFIRSCR